jgi:drug/metabolite transporter (DMT)-like permease
VSLAFPNRGRPLATLALFAGATCIAFAPIFVRAAETGPVSTAFWRVFLSLPVAWIWFARQMRTQQDASNRRPLMPLVLAGLFFAGDLGIWHVSIILTSVANSTLLVNTAPVFVTLGAWLLFGQRMRPLFWLALVLALGGAAILVRATLAADATRLTGDVLALVAALCYAGYQLSVFKSRTTWPTGATMAVSATLTCIALLPYMLLSGEALLPHSLSGWSVLAALAVVAQLGGQGLITYAVAHMPASLASVGLLLQPVMSALFAWALLGETLSGIQAIGGMIVLAGIALAHRASAR